MINRYSSKLRWANITTRTLHVAVAGVVFGGAVLASPHERIATWHHLAIASGILLLLLEWLHDPAWPHRGMGLVAYLHILLGLLIHALPGMAVPLLWGIVISGCIGSHMPRRYRHWSIVYGPEKRKEMFPSTSTPKETS